MMIVSRHPLFQALTELSHLYPPMRFGQLIVFASTLAAEEMPGEAEEVGDEALLEATRAHTQRRSAQLGVKPNGSLNSLPATRAALFHALEELRNHLPQRLGHLVSALAVNSGVNIYDIEDELLLETGEKQLARIGNRFPPAHMKGGH